MFALEKEIGWINLRQLEFHGIWHQPHCLCILIGPGTLGIIALTCFNCWLQGFICV